MASGVSRDVYVKQLPGSLGPHGDLCPTTPQLSDRVCARKGLSALSYRAPKEYCEPAEFQPIGVTASE